MLVRRLVAWDVSRSVIAFEHDRPKPNLPKRRGIYRIPMFSKGLLIGKHPFQDGAMPGKNCPFQDTLPTSSENTILQLNMEGLDHCKQDERSSLFCSAV